jgi:hypothetical protein
VRVTPAALLLLCLFAAALAFFANRARTQRGRVSSQASTSASKSVKSRPLRWSAA